MQFNERKLLSELTLEISVQVGYGSANTLSFSLGGQLAFDAGSGFGSAAAYGDEDYSQAASLITDVDVALESAELFRRTVMRDAGLTVVAQANQQPEMLLVL